MPTSAQEMGFRHMYFPSPQDQLHICPNVVLLGCRKYLGVCSRAEDGREIVNGGADEGNSDPFISLLRIRDQLLISPTCFITIAYYRHSTVTLLAISIPW